MDIAYAPFVDGFQVFFANIKNYDTTAGRPNMQRFIKVARTRHLSGVYRFDAHRDVVLHVFKFS